MVNTVDICHPPSCLISLDSHPLSKDKRIGSGYYAKELTNWWLRQTYSILIIVKPNKCYWVGGLCKGVRAAKLVLRTGRV